ncbi:winged helix DNA-binding domain-containing protein [Streptomyces angustmyceticus]|uniref:winged helix DNA-binding domain-containing protein n=1 Tax=Streptomyces angustmyceticus TaxID=285578 RepID=UPI003D90AC10
MPPLSPRTLNRTYLDRQLLLDRSARTPLDAVRHLMGLQGQEPDAPYTGLWARLADFRHDALTALLHDRRVVRAKLQRNTQHLVDAEDFRTLHPLLAPVLGKARQGAFGRAVQGLDPDDLARAGRELLSGEGLTRPQLGRALAARFPGRDSLALAYVVQSLVAHVHPPPSGVWGRRGATGVVLAEEWLGGPMARRPRVDEVVLRYLAAYGPATVRDVQAWCGLTRLREVVDGMRSRLRVYHDAAGRELFDVPGAALADPDRPAPVRFLPRFDNLILSHADRTRVIGDEDRKRVIVGSEVSPVFLVDGWVRGVWAWRDGTVEVTPFRPLGPEEAAAVREEAGLLSGFLRGPDGSGATGRPAAGAAGEVVIG